LGDQDALFIVKFKLQRSGEARFYKLIFSDHVIEANNFEEAERSYFYVQSYIFLKDMVHRHRHHNAEDDTFVEMRRCVGDWRRNIAFQLMKRVIRRPVSGDADSYQEAIGILSYLKAYQHNVAEVYSLDSLNAMSGSLSAEYNKMKDKLASSKWIFGILYGLIVFCLNRFVSWKQEDIGLVQVLIVMLLATLIFIFAQNSGMLNYERRKWYTDTQKLVLFRPITSRILILGAILILFVVLVHFLGVTSYFSKLTELANGSFLTIEKR